MHERLYTFVLFPVGGKRWILSMTDEEFSSFEYWVIQRCSGIFQYYSFDNFSFLNLSTQLTLNRFPFFINQITQRSCFASLNPILYSGTQWFEWRVKNSLRWVSGNSISHNGDSEAEKTHRSGAFKALKSFDFFLKKNQIDYHNFLPIPTNFVDEI